MSRKYQNIAPLFILSLGVLLLSSCIADEYPSTEVSPSADTTDDMSGIITVFFPVSTGSYASSTRATEYDAGTDFENTIDSYRVFLYDTDNIYVGELENTTLLPSSSGATDRYILSGQCDYAILSQHDDIKVVFIANWPYCYDRLRDDIAPAVGSTIEDLCTTPEYSLYFWFDSENGSYRKDIIDEYPDEGYIAFYGVHEYDNYKTQFSEVIELTEPLTLLRAPAKVEVVFDEEIDVGDIGYIFPYHLKLYNTCSCAPIGVYHQSDYVNGHLLKENMNNINESGKQNNGNNGSTAYTLVTSALGEWDGNTWQIYFPEWDNTFDDYNYIYFLYKDKEYYIYFANYVDGKTTAYSDEEPSDKPDRVNIMRNVLYRFHVSVRPSYPREISVEMTTMPWVVEDIGITVE